MSRRDRLGEGVLRTALSNWSGLVLPVRDCLVRGDLAEALEQIARLEQRALEVTVGGVGGHWCTVDHEAPACLARARELIASGAPQAAILELEALAFVRWLPDVRDRYRAMTRPRRRRQRQYDLPLAGDRP